MPIIFLFLLNYVLYYEGRGQFHQPYVSDGHEVPAFIHWPHPPCGPISQGSCPQLVPPTAAPLTKLSSTYCFSRRAVIACQPCRAHSRPCLFPVCPLQLGFQGKGMRCTLLAAEAGSCWNLSVLASEG